MINLFSSIFEKIRKYRHEQQRKNYAVVDFNMRDFSSNPSARYYSDGKNSAEMFREEYLMPMLRELPEKTILRITIDTVEYGYGASFLSHAFASVVSYGYLTADELLDKIEIRYSNSHYRFYDDRIKHYISNASYRSCTYQATKSIDIDR